MNEITKKTAVNKNLMEIITHTSGKATGRISVLKTIETMAIGDIWVADPADVVTSTVQVACSEYGKLYNKLFKVSLVENPGKITITRKR